jgi:hypothetical protein
MKVHADQGKQQGKWLVNTLHGLTGPPYGGWLQADFTAYLDYLVGKNLWVAAFGSVVKYIKERDASSLSVASQTSNKIVLRLTARPLGSTIFDEPLTIRSTVPAS